MQVFLIKKQIIILAVLQAFKLSFSMLEMDSVHVHKNPLFLPSFLSQLYALEIHVNIHFYFING